MESQGSSDVKYCLNIPCPEKTENRYWIEYDTQEELDLFQKNYFREKDIRRKMYLLLIESTRQESEMNKLIPVTALKNKKNGTI